MPFKALNLFLWVASLTKYRNIRSVVVEAYIQGYRCKTPEWKLLLRVCTKNTFFTMVLDREKPTESIVSDRSFSCQQQFPRPPSGSGGVGGSGSGPGSQSSPKQQTSPNGYGGATGASAGSGGPGSAGTQQRGGSSAAATTSSLGTSASPGGGGGGAGTTSQGPMRRQSSKGGVAPPGTTGSNGGNNGESIFPLLHTFQKVQSFQRKSSDA